MGSESQPLNVWRTVVPNEWIDYNGHLTEGFYGVAFGAASDAVLVALGFGPEYLANHGSFYTVETRIRYIREVKEGAEIYTNSLVLGADSKRLHVHHNLFAGKDLQPVATQECMMLHVSQGPDGPAVSTMLEPVASKVLAAATAHAAIETPGHVGKGVRTLR